MSVGEAEARFDAVKPKLCTSFNSLEAQKVALEAVEIFTHAELHCFNIREVSLDKGHIGTNGAKMLKDDVVWRVGHGRTLPEEG
ncbi:MAG: hypothetical protein M3Y57_16890 [Acidobacteriota bacterium]|nr:hypothetical protein [Acidobacteriota bacterium]